ncbi:MAG: type II secretion system protein [Acutalibacteraceae bacterium]|nr:type II secretion system protein [Clostridiales bacterium]
MLIKLRKKLLEKSGMTLVETVVGFSLLAIASTMLFTGLMTSVSLIKEANDYKVSSARVSTALDVEDEALIVSSNNETMSLPSVGGSTVPGEYYKYSDGGKISYKVFVPSSLDPN